MFSIPYVEPPPSSQLTRDMLLRQPMTKQRLARKIEKINASNKLMALINIIAALAALILIISSYYSTGMDASVLLSLGTMGLGSLILNKNMTFQSYFK